MVSSKGSARGLGKNLLPCMVIEIDHRVLMESAVNCWSIPSIDTLNRHSVNTLVDKLTSQWKLVNRWIISNHYIWVSWLLTKDWSSVDRELAKYWSRCQCWSRVSMESQSWMLLVHMKTLFQIKLSLLKTVLVQLTCTKALHMWKCVHAHTHTCILHQFYTKLIGNQFFP